MKTIQRSRCRQSHLNRVLTRMLLVIPMATASCSPLDPSYSEGYVQDALDGAIRAQVKISDAQFRVLFSLTHGGSPTMGGEYNLAFLILSATHMGFETYCMSSRGPGLDLLKTNGVIASGDYDAPDGTLPYRLPKSLVDRVVSSLNLWRDNPGQETLRTQTLNDFASLEEWTHNGDPASSDFDIEPSRQEKMLLRAIRMRETVIRQKIDTVVVADDPDFSFASLLACNGLKTRVIVYVQSTPRANDDGLYAHELNIMTVSQDSAKRFNEKQNVSIVKNGLNLNRFSPTPKITGDIRAELGIAPSSFLIGHTGYIFRSKNQVAVIRAALALSKVRKDVHTVLAGNVADEGYMQEICTLIKENHFEDHVHFLGNRSDVDALLKDLDLFIFPSHHEGFGLGLAEAMGTEIPAIANDLPAFREFVGDTVTLIPLDDDGSQLAAAALHVMNNPVEAKRRARRSRQQLIDSQRDSSYMARSFAILLGATSEPFQVDDCFSNNVHNL